MKKLLLLCVVALLFAPEIFAGWARHVVVSTAAIKPAPGLKVFTENESELARAVSVVQFGKAEVKITISQFVKDEPDKGYFLVTNKQRMAKDGLDFRHPVYDWHMRESTRGYLARLREARLEATTKEEIARLDRVFADARPKADTIEAFRPLKLLDKDGDRVLEIVLDEKIAMRSYLVWDFKFLFERASVVSDGGLTLTYDLPAFIEASRQAKSIKSK